MRGIAVEDDAGVTHWAPFDGTDAPMHGGCLSDLRSGLAVSMWVLCDHKPASHAWRDYGATGRYRDVTCLCCLADPAGEL